MYVLQIAFHHSFNYTNIEKHNKGRTFLTMEQRTEQHNKSHTFLTMEQRTELARKVCVDKLGTQPIEVDNITNVDLPPRIIISDRYKLLGCLIDKVGSTNLQRIFYILNGLTNTTDPGNVKQGDARKQNNDYFYKLRKPSHVTEIISRLKSYTTFMIVRPPLDRIVSAYRDNKPNAIFRNWKEKSTVPNFEKYIDILLKNKTHYSKPLRPLYMMCNPCRISFNFIGNLDNFDTDMATILRAVDAENTVSVPQRMNTGYKKQKSSEVVKMYYKDIPTDKLEKLEQIYDLDYALFGFEKYKDIL